MLKHPDLRMRRLREKASVREMVRETRISAANFIYPMFVTHGENVREEIEPMPGCYHTSIDRLNEEIDEVVELGIPSVLLFGLPPEKDAVGSGAYDPEGIIQEATRTIKERAPGLMVIGDVCLCEYTDHGHCGVINGEKIDNDVTLDLLARSALTQVQAGADMVAPSSMMDGQVRAIRETLDAHGYEDTPIMGYAASQVRLVVLRAVPRRRRFHAAVWRPPQLPDGPGQPPHGHARNRVRHRRRRRHRDGQARHGLHGRHQRGPRTL